MVLKHYVGQIRQCGVSMLNLSPHPMFMRNQNSVSIYNIKPTFKRTQNSVSLTI